MPELKQKTQNYLGFLFIWVGLIVAFAVVYYLLSVYPGHSPSGLSGIRDPLERFLTALYFSVITGATVGYGDVVPLGWSRFFASVEAILSFVVLALFVARISSRQQDEAIANIHALARDSLFNNFRHGLFIARKDLDNIISEVREGSALTDRDWKNIRTAFRQMHTHIGSVPKLYASGRSGATIDADHEQLVLDSVERSLRRAREVIVELESTNASCRSDERCMSELQSMVRSADHSFVTLFAKAFNTENDEAFTEMLSRLKELRAHL